MYDVEKVLKALPPILRNAKMLDYVLLNNSCYCETTDCSVLIHQMDMYDDIIGGTFTESQEQALLASSLNFSKDDKYFVVKKDRSCKVELISFNSITDSKFPGDLLNLALDFSQDIQFNNTVNYEKNELFNELVEALKNCEVN